MSRSANRRYTPNHNIVLHCYMHVLGFTATCTCRGALLHARAVAHCYMHMSWRTATCTCRGTLLHTRAVTAPGEGSEAAAVGGATPWREAAGAAPGLPPAGHPQQGMYVRTARRHLLLTAVAERAHTVMKYSDVTYMYLRQIWYLVWLSLTVICCIQLWRNCYVTAQARSVTMVTAARWGHGVQQPAPSVVTTDTCM